MTDLPTTILRYGKDQTFPERVNLRAGQLSLVFEEGELRRVCLGAREVVRRVYVAVRDCYWNTVVPIISGVRVESDGKSFDVTYEAEHVSGGLDFRWRATITGDARGIITFTMDGETRSTFQRNRIGFCVLHPVRECAGRRCIIEPADGSAAVRKRFPREISPHQPFTDVRAMSHQVSRGVRARVQFEGDVFETEDQRNWTDASYKTYSTPLSLPFPVEIKQGTRISQSVVISLEGDTVKTRTNARRNGNVLFNVGQPSSIPLPRLGLGVASHGRLLDEREASRLKALNLSHLRIDLNLSEGDYAPALTQAATEAQAINASLEIALTLSDAAEAELKKLRGVLERVSSPVSAWMIFHRDEKVTGAKWIEIARRYLKDYRPGAKIGGGTNLYFTELNREHPDTTHADFVSYSVNPQVHAFDNWTLIENLQGQAETIRSARQFLNGLPLAISPITLRPRFNPNAAVSPNAEASEVSGDLPDAVDARQMSLFGAAWTIGSLKQVAEGGVYSATYYETSGWRGVMETTEGSPLPEKFRSLPGAVFPLYHVFADFGEFAGGLVVPSKSSDP
ncbi:MAG TPA: hypothetical protein VM943_00070, partial [Pyrinomonadaceae bacterium]|nr:hypothetical protein [Pyrinomonadaceae bacterium]